MKKERNSRIYLPVGYRLDPPVSFLIPQGLRYNVDTSGPVYYSSSHPSYRYSPVLAQSEEMKNWDILDQKIMQSRCKPRVLTEDEMKAQDIEIEKLIKISRRFMDICGIGHKKVEKE